MVSQMNPLTRSCFFCLVVHCIKCSSLMRMRSICEQELKKAYAMMDALLHNTSLIMLLVLVDHYARNIIVHTTTTHMHVPCVGPAHKHTSTQGKHARRTCASHTLGGILTITFPRLAGNTSLFSTEFSTYTDMNW